MSKKTGTIAIVISVLAICISIFSLYRSTSERQTGAGDKDIQYVMYLGTNDKDTYEPFGTAEEAKAKVDELLTKHFEGFTIQEANGGWTNEDGTVSHEYTIVILLSDTSSEEVHKAADDLIQEFNQSSVLIQANETKTEFYSGGE
ncbi:DUF3574 domain-containing protein [Butyrivibrio sp. MC2013]|uniref:DUF3574 domain-containing protein n=1 Tax=Butyrivibrio sp. MC2013 TaxID=1280686 RepID=UPI00042154A2|nr:DUF3574 domain-containing protein [Butyrivibrio sp. MC2013]